MDKNNNSESSDKANSHYQPETEIDVSNWFLRLQHPWHQSRKYKYIFTVEKDIQATYFINILYALLI
jgi:hypothetical protein